MSKKPVPIVVEQAPQSVSGKRYSDDFKRDAIRTSCASGFIRVNELEDGSGSNCGSEIGNEEDPDTRDR
jgi:hypothetical protein